LYGRTIWGGLHDRGTIFRVGPSGGLTVLHSFTVYAGPEGLIEGVDGSFYGATRGDSATAPTIFRMDRAGNVTTFYSFADAGVSSIVGPLAQTADGTLYGIGFGPGVFNVGGLFKITREGTFTVVYSFEASFVSEVGYRPVEGLLRSSDGGLYGTTSAALLGLPSIFRFDPETETISAVARLGVNGPLHEAPDGAIYGWTSGTSGSIPAVLRLTRDRMDRYDVVGAEGSGFSGLFRAADGALYGTLNQGPQRSFEPDTWSVDVFSGGVFRLTIPATP
jgi:uncharacterized repeat protein (TIGR03803 family)